MDAFILRINLRGCVGEGKSSCLVREKNCTVLEGRPTMRCKKLVFSNAYYLIYRSKEKERERNKINRGVKTARGRRRLTCEHFFSAFYFFTSTQEHKDVRHSPTTRTCRGPWLGSFCETSSLPSPGTNQTTDGQEKNKKKSLFHFCFAYKHLKKKRKKKTVHFISSREHP